MINFNEVKDKIKEYGYYATEELLYDTYNALLLFESNKISNGQDIYAACLDGPPGAGKTEFAKTYYKLSNEIFKNVEFVEYQCDATTGKTELFEDINISAAIRGDADNVNIPGKLIDAIKKVNIGKKVILFIDEYDKAREETDAFLLQFLQSGKINLTQHGDLAIKDEYKSNLQVILCKNDFREELSGPLSRRLRMTSLSYMKPDVFYTVANRVLVKERENSVNDGLINLVSIIYENVYANKDRYNRLPSCSEMLIALEDADRLMKMANAPKNIIYNIIIKNMFKSHDDKETFESILNNSQNMKLKNLINSMRNASSEEVDVDINEVIAEKLFLSENEKLILKRQELQNLINEYKEKFSRIEETRKNAVNDEVNNIKLQNGELVTTNKPSAISLFQDETARIKRGYDIFNLSTNDWTLVGTINKNNLSYNYFISKLIEFVDDFDIVLYENGILLNQVEEYKLIVITEFIRKSSFDGNSYNDIQFSILCNYPVLPYSFLSDISAFGSFVNECYEMQPKTGKAITDDAIGLSGSSSIDTLVYTENNLEYEKVMDNVYHIELRDSVNFVKLNSLPDIDSDNFLEFDKAKEASEQLLQGRQKVLKK